MMLVGSATAFFLACLSTCLLIEPSRGRPADAAVGPIGQHTRIRRASRRIAVVVDITREYGIRSTDDRDVLIFPAHTYVVFGRTRADDPLVVELASPMINRRPRGLAVAVSDYTQTAGGAEFGPLEPPRNETRIRRVIDILPQNTTATNEDIFDPRLGKANLGRPASIVERLWVDNFVVNDEAGYGSAMGWFGDSHEFVDMLLEQSPFLYTRNQRDRDAPATAHAMASAQEWARMARLRWRSEEQYASLSTKGLPFLVYEAARRDPHPPLVRGDRPRMQPYQALYTISTPDEGTCVPWQVDKGLAQNGVLPSVLGGPRIPSETADSSDVVGGSGGAREHHSQPRPATDVRCAAGARARLPDRLHHRCRTGPDRRRTAIP